MNYSIIYQSIAKETFTKPEIDTMLIGAKHRNRQNNVTGCIIFKDKKFLQIIEGPKTNVLNLYSNIKSDNRHHGIELLLETTSSDTLWDDWSMAFYNFDGVGDENKYSRILMETFFENVRKALNKSLVFKTFKDSAMKLINS